MMPTYYDYCVLIPLKGEHTNYDLIQARWIWEHNSGYGVMTLSCPSLIDLYPFEIEDER